MSLCRPGSLVSLDPSVAPCFDSDFGLALASVDSAAAAAVAVAAAVVFLYSVRRQELVVADSQV